MNSITTIAKPIPKDRSPVDVDVSRPVGTSFLSLVNGMSRQMIQRCYQCIKCTNGCPVAEVMDFPPDQVLKMVQLGLKEEVLASNTMWICAACRVCTARCPNDVNIARVMHALRKIAFKNGVKIADENMLSLHQRFLQSVRERGRLNEFPELLKHRFKSLQFFSDARLGMRMFRKGKLTLKSNAMKNASQVKQIFHRYFSPTMGG